MCGVPLFSGIFASVSGIILFTNILDSPVIPKWIQFTDVYMNQHWSKKKMVLFFFAFPLNLNYLLFQLKSHFLWDQSFLFSVKVEYDLVFFL